MGTTLTGTTPQTTYDSLIKVTDNGPLGGSLKTLTDGLGNDSALALSTGAASVTGTLSVSNTLTLSGYGSGTKTGTVAYNLAVDSSGNVIETAGGVVDGSGTANYVSKWSDPNTLTNSLIYDNGTSVSIGTTSPSAYSKLQIKVGTDFNLAIGQDSGALGLGAYNDALNANADINITAANIKFSSGGERMRITSAGDVGIGTSSPATLLQVAGTTSFYNGAASTGAISAGQKETVTTGFNLGAGESVDISTISITSSTTWKAILVGGYANNIEGGGLVSPSLEIELDNSSATVAVGSVNITFSRNSSTGKLQATNSSGSGRGTFVGTIEVFNFPQSLVPTTSKIIRGNVGIGTSSPASKLHVEGAFGTSSGAYISGSTYGMLGVNRGASNASAGIQYYNIGSQKWFAGIYENSDNFGFYSVGTSSFPMVIEYSTGNVGIGTSSPSSKLVVNGDIATSGNIALTGSGAGIFLGGSIGSANGLDDYEEGTWTMGVSFGGASVGVTYSRNTGTYTKIGRQVTVNGQLLLTNKGSSTGDANLTGLPFTIPNAFENYSAPSLSFSNITFTNQFQGNCVINSTNVYLSEITNAGVVSGLTDADFANNSSIIISLTYFV